MRIRHQWFLRRVLADQIAQIALRRSFATKPPTKPSRPPPFPTVETCPSPTCACAPMPEGLEIDHKAALNGVMSAYAEQVLICTGQDDWGSRIEEEDGGSNLAAGLKGLFGRGGKFMDPFHNISVLNSSFQSPTPEESTSAYLLPSFKYIPSLSTASLPALAKGYLLPTKLHPMNDALSPEVRDNLLRDESFQSKLSGVTDVNEVLLLICGHGGRDVRCGVMGSLLRGEFEEKLGRISNFEVRKGAAEAAQKTEGSEKRIGARIGLISHIGGHKFAGNVIIYIPPRLKIDGKAHPLAGHGIWYGRVEPRHVEGIVQETIVKGSVVADMFRGGIDTQRRILRL